MANLSYLVLGIIAMATNLKDNPPSMHSLVAVPLSAVQSSQMNGPLRVHPQNGRYFTDSGGRAIYLTGSHTWSNLQDNVGNRKL